MTEGDFKKAEESFNSTLVQLKVGYLVSYLRS